MQFCGIFVELYLKLTISWGETSILTVTGIRRQYLCGSHWAPASHNGAPAARSDPGLLPVLFIALFYNCKMEWDSQIDLFDPVEIQYNSSNLDWSWKDANCKICQFKLSSLIIITSFPENLTFLKTLILSETLLILNLTTIFPSLEITLKTDWFQCLTVH